eukprot:gene7385-biopygen15083
MSDFPGVGQRSTPLNPAAGVEPLNRIFVGAGPRTILFLGAEQPSTTLRVEERSAQSTFSGGCSPPTIIDSVVRGVSGTDETAAVPWIHQGSIIHPIYSILGAQPPTQHPCAHPCPTPCAQPRSTPRAQPLAQPQAQPTLNPIQPSTSVPSVCPQPLSRLSQPEEWLTQPAPSPEDAEDVAF